MELNAIRDAPVSDAELARARSYIGLGLPGEFETTGQMANQIGDLLTYGLPPTYPNGYVRKVIAVTGGDVQRVARTYFDPAMGISLLSGTWRRSAPVLRPSASALSRSGISKVRS